MEPRGVIWGVRWSFGGQIGKVGLNLLINILLLRLLDPSIFGMMAMSFVFSGFLSLFISLGTGTSLIYYADIRQATLSSIFWLNVFSGLFLGGIFALSGNWLAGFYEEPKLSGISWFFGLNILLQAMGVVPLTLLQKSLAFNKLLWVELIPLALSGGIAVLLAYQGWGIYSLLLQMLLHAAILFILALWASAFKPSWYFSFQKIKPHLHFGGPLMVESTLNYIVRNIDDLLIGKFLGNGPLGLYNKSYSILLFPLKNFSRVISRVLFPSFSIIKEDKVKVSAQFLKTCRAIGLIVFPLTALLFITAQEVVPVVLGNSWSGAIPMIQVFSILAAFQSVGSLSGVLYQSMGATRLQMQVGLIVKPFMIGMIIAGLLITRSALGVAQFYTIASILAIFPELFFGGRLIGLSLKELGERLSFSFFPSLACALVVGLGCRMSLSFEGDWGRLIIKSLAFCLSYFTLLRILPGNNWKELLELGKAFFDRR